MGAPNRIAEKWFICPWRAPRAVPVLEPCGLTVYHDHELGQESDHLAVDRSVGWTRQLRITPLRARTEIAAKVLAAYLVALPTLAVVFALFGGVFGSFFNGATLAFTKLLPSYWLAHAGKAALVSGAWPGEGWIVVAMWTVALVVAATFAYRRDTGHA